MENTSSKEPLVYVDGEFIPKSQAKVSVYDHGLLYGDGVFEGIKIYNGVAFKLREHVRRLYDSASFIELNIPVSQEEMVGIVVNTVKTNRLNDAYVRLVVTRGVGDLGLDPRKCPRPSIICIAEPVRPYHGAEAGTQGIKAIIATVRRDSVNATTHEVKSLNYLNSVLGMIEANRAGVNEAIFLDTRGFVSEATGENVFAVKDGKVYTTPPSSGILRGITRKRIMELVTELGYELVERDITPFELLSSDEVFLTGTMAEIVPVTSINSKVIGDRKVGKVTKKIMEAFSEITKRSEEGVPVGKGTLQEAKVK